jgi:hypothetical protein
MPISDRVVSRRRLTKLADFLDVLPRRRFNYAKWCIVDQKKPKSCGTQACAWGWTPEVPGFRRLGVKPNGVTGPIFEGYSTFEGAAQFFRIDPAAAHKLFAPEVEPNEDKATPKYVARKIRKWVKENLS